MTRATRDALEQIARILHDAGWDDPSASADGLPADGADRTITDAPDPPRESPG